MENLCGERVQCSLYVAFSEYVNVNHEIVRMKVVVFAGRA